MTVFVYVRISFVFINSSYCDSIILLLFFIINFLCRIIELFF